MAKSVLLNTPLFLKILFMSVKFKTLNCILLWGFVRLRNDSKFVTKIN